MKKIKKGDDNLNGSVPDNSVVSLVLIDVINTLEFPDGTALLKPFEAMSRNLEKLLTRARNENIPVIYVNDNFGKWRSDFKNQIDSSLANKSINRANVKRVLPAASDYYVLKPKHSAFYASPLEIMLRSLGCKTIILCGITVESCVLFTAADAHLREYDLIIPLDCVASGSSVHKKNTLKIMKDSLHAKIIKGASIDFKRLKSSQS